MVDDTYLFHQTPVDLAKQLIDEVELHEDDIVLEPFKWEGAIYDKFPDYVVKEWCEIEKGRDYKYHDGRIDWVISNPPYKLDGKNCFWKLIEYYLDRVDKGIAFLCNDYCLASITPSKIKIMNDKGFYVNKIVVCCVKKWRGRYFFIVIDKHPSNFYKSIQGTY